jgi:hypothetical protein
VQGRRHSNGQYSREGFPVSHFIGRHLPPHSDRPGAQLGRATHKPFSLEVRLIALLIGEPMAQAGINSILKYTIVTTVSMALLQPAIKRGRRFPNWPAALLFHGVHVPRNDSEIAFSASKYCLPISMGVCQPSPNADVSRLEVPSLMGPRLSSSGRGQFQGGRHQTKITTAKHVPRRFQSAMGRNRRLHR